MADFRKAQYAFAAHLRNPDASPAPAGIEDRRLKIYRDLFFNNMQSLLAGTFPVLHRLLGEARWRELTRAFYSRHISHSPHFVEVPQEFLAWLTEEFQNNGSWPAFMQELAHYEWVELALAIDQQEIDAEKFDPEGNLLDESPVVSPVAWPLAYRFPVHRIGPEFQPSEPGEQPTFLVIYRRRNDDVAFTEINAITARLLELLQQDVNATGRETLAAVAGEIGHDAAVVVKQGQDILERLKQQDIILGTRR